MRCHPLLVLLLVPACTVGEAPPDKPNDDDPPLPAQPTTPKVSSVSGGTFQPLGTYTSLAGSVLMVKQLDGKTNLSVAISGLTPMTMYTAHVHNAPCAYGAGGGHYKLNPLVADVIETNELWLKGMSGMTGALAAEQTFDHLARGSALSIVIHDPAGGAKMACADLRPDDVPMLESSGMIAPFAAATAADQTVSGTITAMRTATATTFTLNATGLDKLAVGYETHIHHEPCATATAGGHYKLDPSVVETLQANEIWLPITNFAATGTAMATLNVPHVTRTDAQSFVIHRVITETPPNKPKVACADLTRKVGELPLATTGNAISLTPDANISGTAIMTRKLTGVTEVALVMTGLVPDTTYDAHVHNLPCAVEKGGGHYKFDRTVAGAEEANEIWFKLTANAEGSASDSTWVDKLAAADAQSLVVHGGDARAACFDLK